MYIFLSLLLLPFAWLFTALDIKYLFNWFIVPLTQWAPLNMHYALGLTMILSLLKVRASAYSTVDTDTKTKHNFEQLISIIIYLIILLVLGFLVHKCVQYMPTYTYECQLCDKTFEVVHSMKTKPKRKCPECGHHTLELVITPPAIKFIGSGFFVNDYKDTP